jgi:hypothetical protein
MHIELVIPLDLVLNQGKEMRLSGAPRADVKQVLLQLALQRSSQMRQRIVQHGLSSHRD